MRNNQQETFHEFAFSSKICVTCDIISETTDLNMKQKLELTKSSVVHLHIIHKICIKYAKTGTFII